MDTVAGKVDKVYRNEVKTKYGLKKTTRYQIDGVYYSGGFKDWGINEGDVVELKYEVNSKGYNDVKSVSVTDKNPNPPSTQAAPQASTQANGARRYRQNGEEGGFPLHPLSYERALDRRNALNAAIAFVGSEATVEDVLDIARTFEAYTTGDLDKEEALAIIQAQEKGGK